jgi:hydroxyacylglutathione hydrolase
MSSLPLPVRLSPHIHVLYSEYPHVDCANVFLVTGDVPTLIDCGSPRGVPRLLRNLDTLGLSINDVQQIIVTHGDYDHVQGLHTLLELNPALRVYLHEADLPVVLGDDSYRNASYIYGRVFQPFGQSRFLPLADGAKIPAGNFELTVVHTPGHTEGSVCLHGWIDDTSVLFAGDTIGGAMKSLEGANLEVWARSAVTWHQSLQKLGALDFGWVLNGHEPASTLPLLRSHVDRMVRSFGTMLSPWVTLGDDMPESEGATAEQVVSMATP